MNISVPEDRYYIATMKPYGDEGEKRIARHMKLRDGKGFRTIECPVNIASALDEIEDASSASILVECVSNLLANEMFGSDETMDSGNPAGPVDLANATYATSSENPDDSGNHIASRVINGIIQLASGVKNMVIVSNNVFEDGTGYDDATLEYMRCLAMINRILANISDSVTEVVAGIPVLIR